MFELREAKARGDAHRAAQWALFINETTNIIIGEQRRRRLP
ncbi:MAG TPA: hypothetical protein VM305_02110 [Candidatus Limnocylindrales bacterium]|nr:hypothetical protein [Candidatus Limnocylindrales bacterium]